MLPVHISTMLLTLVLKVLMNIDIILRKQAQKNSGILQLIDFSLSQYDITYCLHAYNTLGLLEHTSHFIWSRQMSTIHKDSIETWKCL